LQTKKNKKTGEGRGKQAPEIREKTKKGEKRQEEQRQEIQERQKVQEGQKVEKVEEGLGCASAWYCNTLQHAAKHCNTLQQICKR